MVNRHLPAIGQVDHELVETVALRRYSESARWSSHCPCIGQRRLSLVNDNPSGHASRDPGVFMRTRMERAELQSSALSNLGYPRRFITHRTAATKRSISFLPVQQ
jgi:hypothetical protein